MSFSASMSAYFKPDTFPFQSSNTQSTISPNITTMSAVPQIQVSATKIVSGFLDLHSMVAPEKFDAMLRNFFDGLALGATELSMSKAGDLPDLIGDLTESLGKDETTSAAFDLGRALGQELDGDHGKWTVTSPDGADAGIPDPGDLSGETGIGAMDVFRAVRDPLGLLQESAVEHPNLKTGHGWNSEVIEDFDHGQAAKDGLALANVVLLVAHVHANPPPLAAVALVVSAAVTLAAAAHAVQDTKRPTGDGPTADDADTSFEETFELMAQKAGGLVLKFFETQGVEPPEDMPAFDAALRQALWDSVSRPSGTEEEGDSNTVEVGLDPEDLQHELEPDTEIDIPLPEGTNPDEPFDPIAGATTFLDDTFLF